MTNTYYVGQDDSNWIMDILCSDVNGPVELVAASSILVYLQRSDNTESVNALTCTAVADYAFTVGLQGQPGYFVNPGTSGYHCIARLTGTADETAVSGVYSGRVQATWSNGTVRSFPTTSSFFTVNITPRP